MLSLVRLSIVVAIALAVAAPATQAAQDPFTMTATSYTTGYSPCVRRQRLRGDAYPRAGHGLRPERHGPDDDDRRRGLAADPGPGGRERCAAAGLGRAALHRQRDRLLARPRDGRQLAAVGRHADRRRSARRLDWTSPAGHTTHLAYDVLADLARPHVATVRLRLTPAWTGPGPRHRCPRQRRVQRPDRRSPPAPIPGQRQTTLTVETPGTNVTVAYASQLALHRPSRSR